MRTENRLPRSGLLTVVILHMLLNGKNDLENDRVYDFATRKTQTKKGYGLAVCGGRGKCQNLRDVFSAESV